MSIDVEPMRLSDAAQLVQRSPSTLRNWCDNGWIGRLKGGRRGRGRQVVVDRAEVLEVDALLRTKARPPVRYPRLGVSDGQGG